MLQYFFVKRLREANSYLSNNSDMRYMCKDSLESILKGANNCPIVLEIDLQNFLLLSLHKK